MRNVANTVVTLIGTTSPFYWFLYFVLVVGFTYMYTAIIFQQQTLPETLQEAGRFIPGIRAGRPTAEYLSRRPEPDHPPGGPLPGGPSRCRRSSWKRLTDTTKLTLSNQRHPDHVGVVLDTMKARGAADDAPPRVA